VNRIDKTILTIYISLIHKQPYILLKGDFRLKKILIFSGKFIAAFSFIIIFQQIGFYMLPDEGHLLFPAMALATLYMIFIFDKDKKLNLGLNVNPGQHLHGILAGVILISLSFYFIKLSGALQIVNHQFTFAHVSNLIYLFVLFFIVSFQEELFFRGYLYSLADNLFSDPKISILLTSFLFSITHAANPNALSSPVPLLNIFLAGFLLGFFRLYSKGIWMPIGFHWSWNFLQGGFFGFEVSGISLKSILQIEPSQNHWLSGGQFGAEGSIITTLLFLVTIAGYWFIFQNRKKDSSK